MASPVTSRVRVDIGWRMRLESGSATARVASFSEGFSFVGDFSACVYDRPGKARSRGVEFRACRLLLKSWSRARRASLKRDHGDLGDQGRTAMVGLRCVGVFNQRSLRIDRGAEVGN